MRANKSYFLPISKSCQESCEYCPGLGCKSDQTKSKYEISFSVNKAQKSYYQNVLLPCNFLFQKNYLEVLQEITDRKLTPIIMLNTKTLHNNWLELLTSLNEYNPKYLFVIDGQNPDEIAFINSIDPLEIKYDCLLVVRKNLKMRPILDHLNSQALSNLYFYYPLHINKEDPFLETNAVRKNIDWLSKNYPEVSVRPYPGIDTFDPRINSDLNLEPLLLPNINNTLENNDIKISVVIPTYNFKVYVTNTVKHLFQQTLKNKHYEVIVVDDGSTDSTEEFLSNYLQEDIKQHNFKYIHFPRNIKRKMGDGNFRAGIARNLGVKHASGEYLCFLDSDIITPKDFLQKLLDQHTNYDVIQTQRHYLKQNVSGLETQYSSIDIENDTFIPEGGYWHKFYSDPMPWMQRKHPWKFVCTYSLSMKRQLFLNLGSFKKNYHFYGFEDTCIGLRAWQNNMSLHLSDLVVYHLFHANERSEYKNSDLHRMNLLKKTAKIFYHNHLNPDIYEALGNLVQPPITFHRIKSDLALWWRAEK